MAKKVKLLVSEATIRDAHNLDDLRQRWLDRRSQYDRYRQKDEIGFNFEYSLPQDIDSARDLREIARKEEHQLKLELTKLRSLKNSTWKQARKEEILARHQYVLEWIRIYKNLIIQITKDREKLEPYQVLLDSISSSGDDVKLALVKLGYKLLKELARSGRVQFSKEEGAIVGALRQYLYDQSEEDS